MNFCHLAIVCCAVYLTMINRLNAQDTIPGVDKNVHYLQTGVEKMLVSKGSSRLEILCYAGEERNILTLLKTVEVVLNVPDNNFRYYEGSNASVVEGHYQAASWFSFIPWRPHSFRLDIYNHSCIGIETKETFRISLKIRHVDLWRVVTLAFGIGLFVMAPLLAHNVMFHYVTGVSIGVCGSLLIILYFISRTMPKKSAALSLVLGGGGFILYLIQYMWTHFVHYMKEYQNIFIGYLVLSTLVSFCIVYRWGPVTEERSLKLIQWVLQLVGIVLIFISSQFREFTLALIIILLSYYNTPSKFKNKARTFWLKFFPPSLKLLSEEEYLEQSRIETEKALDELRGFCRSPKCNAWKTMSRLSSPQRYDELDARHADYRKSRHTDRFAEFVEGDSHLTDNEILSYESTGEQNENDLFTDDDDYEDSE